MREELETNIYQNAGERDMWYIFTDDPKRIREYKKKELEIHKQVGKGYIFLLPDSQMTVRKKRAKNKPKKSLDT